MKRMNEPVLLLSDPMQVLMWRLGLKDRELGESALHHKGFLITVVATAVEFVPNLSEYFRNICAV